MFKSVLFFLILILVVLLVMRFEKKNHEGYGCGSANRAPERYGSDLVFVYEGNSPDASVGIW